jgi:hypothetical protein
MLFAVWFMLTTGKALAENPFIYGAKQFGGVSCFCTQINLKEKTFTTFGFNETDFWQYGRPMDKSTTFIMQRRIEQLNFTNVTIRGEKVAHQQRGSNGTNNQT